MERRHYTVVGLLVLGALGALTSGCGSKKEESTPETASTATLTPEATAPPAITVPPPTPPVVPPPPTPTTVKTVEKVDPLVDAKSVNSCCVALRRLPAGLSTDDKKKFTNARTTCTDLVGKVKRGEATRDKSLSAVRAAATGLRLPPECT